MTKEEQKMKERRNHYAMSALALEERLDEIVKIRTGEVTNEPGGRYDLERSIDGLIRARTRMKELEKYFPGDPIRPEEIQVVRDDIDGVTRAIMRAKKSGTT